MNYTFTGSTKIISPTDAPVLGAISIDVQDMYSRWVDWFLTSDNSKYLPAMRVVWWDPLPWSKKLGLTYFMLNWWKIKPYEATHTFSLNGNVYSEDWTSSFIPTVGSYNVTIINTVSNLVDSTVQQLPEIEYASFNWRVTIDAVNWVAGVSYPTGTPTNPVNNIVDALSIASTRWFRTIFTNSDLTITTGIDISEYVIESPNWLVVTIDPGVILLNTEFKKVSLYWVMGWVWNILIDCWVYDITNLSWWVRWWSIGDVALAVGTPLAEFWGQSFFDNIVPLFPGNISNITMNTDTIVSMTDVADTVTIKSLTAWSLVACGLLEWQLIVDATCTAGDIKVTWVGDLVNNSAVIVDDSALINPQTVWDEPIRTLTYTWVEAIQSWIAKESTVKGLYWI